MQGVRRRWSLDGWSRSFAIATLTLGAISCRDEEPPATREARGHRFVDATIPRDDTRADASDSAYDGAAPDAASPVGECDPFLADAGNAPNFEAIGRYFGFEPEAFAAAVASSGYDLAVLWRAARAACVRGEDTSVVRRESLLRTVSYWSIGLSCEPLMLEPLQRAALAKAWDVPEADLVWVADELGWSWSQFAIEATFRLDQGYDAAALYASIAEYLLHADPIALQEAAPFAALDGVDLMDSLKGQLDDGQPELTLQLGVRQPLDHWRKDGPGFVQQVTVKLRDPRAPVVLSTGGYGFAIGGPASDLINANAVMMDHRLYAEPPADAETWAYLEPRQAAADVHHVVELLRPLLPGPWVSTGTSKDGSSALIHHHLYPNDVVGTVALGAPLGFHGEPNKGLELLNGIDADGCAERVRAEQRSMLERITEIEDLLVTPSCPGRWDAATLLQTISLFEWNYWVVSGVGACSLIAGAETTVDDLVSLIERFYEPAEAQGAPWLYEQLARWGNANQVRPELDPLLSAAREALGLSDATTQEPLQPWGDAPAFDSSVLDDATKWAAADAEGLLLIYGEYDPWSAWAIDVGDTTNSLKVVMPKGRHAVFDPSNVSANVRTRMAKLLASWVGAEYLQPSVAEAL
jgi:hypothetical protein